MKDHVVSKKQLVYVIKGIRKSHQNCIDSCTYVNKENEKTHEESLNHYDVKPYIRHFVGASKKYCDKCKINSTKRLDRHFQQWNTYLILEKHCDHLISNKLFSRKKAINRKNVS